MTHDELLKLARKRADREWLAQGYLALSAKLEEQSVFQRARDAHADEVIDQRNRQLSEMSVEFDALKAKLEEVQAERDTIRRRVSQLHAWSSDDMTIRHRQVVLVHDLVAALDGPIVPAEASRGEVVKPPPLGSECPWCHKVGMIVRMHGKDVCQYCGQLRDPDVPDKRQIAKPYQKIGESLGLSENLLVVPVEGREVVKPVEDDMKLRKASESVGWINSVGPLSVAPSIPEDGDIIKPDILDELHSIFTVYGIASRSNDYAGLATDVIRWAAQACRQSSKEDIIKACPHCNSFEIETANEKWMKTYGLSFRCVVCWERFIEPAYFRRLSSPVEGK
jgi:hypothetical protein